MSAPADNTGTIETLLHEERVYPPSPEFVAQANVSDPGIYDKAEQDPLGFWRDAARLVDWFKEPNDVLDWKPPFARWFQDGELNACYNAVDRHLATRAAKPPLSGRASRGSAHLHLLGPLS